MRTVQPIAGDGREAVLIPIVSLEELPHRTTNERASLVSELQQAEAEMKAGHFVRYSPEWLRERFMEAFNRSA